VPVGTLSGLSRLLVDHRNLTEADLHELIRKNGLMMKLSIHSHDLVEELEALNQWAAPYLDDLAHWTIAPHVGDLSKARAGFVQARRDATRTRFFSIVPSGTHGP
jgi:hypothetical protein